MITLLAIDLREVAVFAQSSRASTRVHMAPIELSRRPVVLLRPSVRYTSAIRTVDFRTAGTVHAAGGRCEPPTTPHSTYDAPRPAGEGCAVRPGWSRTLRAAGRDRSATPRSTPERSPCSAGRSATTLHSLAAAQRPRPGQACRALVRCRYDRVPPWVIRVPAQRTGDHVDHSVSSPTLRRP
jgi:hypothetical protein